MRKFWVTLAALCGAAVLFCGLLAFAACDPAAEEPSQAERLQRFIDTVDEDTDKFVFAFNAKGKTEKEEYDPLTGTYKPVLDPETGEPLYEEEEVWLQFCNDGVNGYMELHIGIGDDQREYWKRDGDYLYSFALAESGGGNEPWDPAYGQASVEYRPAWRTLKACMTIVTENLLNLSGFWAAFQEAAQAEESGIVFELPAYGISEGTVTFSDEGTTIAFSLAASSASGEGTDSERAAPVGEEEWTGSSSGQTDEAESGAALPVSVTFSFRGLGTNSDVPELAAAGEAFASFTQADLLYAQMEWALGEDSALFDGVLTAAGQQAVSFDAHLHEGEQLQQLTAGTEGGQGITAAVRRGEQFYSVRMYGAVPFVTVGSAQSVADVLITFSFSSFRREYFTLKDGTENVLTLTDTGKAWYNYCDNIEIEFREDGSYFITATGLSVPAFSGSGVDALTLIIADIGETQPIEFPQTITDAVDSYAAQA